MDGLTVVPAAVPVAPTPAIATRRRAGPSEFSPATGGVSPPTTLRLAALPVTDPLAAQGITRRLALGHYENFSVVSLLLPRGLRQDFCNVYAFCRVADDLSDEAASPARAIELLHDFRQQTIDCFAGQSRTAIFAALGGTVARRLLPIQPFLDLIDAFEQDQRVSRYQTYPQLLDYCRRSADPVGRLVLHLCGYRDTLRQALSDRICTGLQLANFWQDVQRDARERDRIYLPADSMVRFGVTPEQIMAGRCDQNYRNLIHFEVDRAQTFFDQGQALLPGLKPSVRMQISLFARGGTTILQSIRDRDYDTLSGRPIITRWRKASLILSSALAQFARLLVAGMADEVSA